MNAFSVSVDSGMQILCTPTEDANGEANEGDGWLAGFYHGQVYFPALGHIYRGAWCWRGRCYRAGTWRGWGPSVHRQHRRLIGRKAAVADIVPHIITAGRLAPERYAFDLCEELDVESLGCTMYTRVNDLVSIRLIAMAWRYLSKSMFGSSGGESEEEDLQAAAIIASMGRKRRWGGSVFGHKIYKCDRAAAERLLMLKYFDEESIFDDDQFRRRYWVAFGFCIDII